MRDLKVADDEIPEIKLRALGGEDLKDIAAEKGVSRTYIQQIVTGKRRAVTVGERVLAQTEPSPKLNEMMSFYKRTMANALMTAFANMDHQPIHDAVVSVMTTVFHLDADTITEMLAPRLESMHVEIKVGEEDG